MRLLIRTLPLRQFLRWTQIALLAGAAAMLSWCGFVLMDTWAFQRTERRELERLLAAPQTNGLTLPAAVSVKPFPPLIAGGLFGRISIARLGVSVIVMEGTSDATLRRAAGHIAGTALPGAPGNIGISGHRDTFFRPLRNIRPDDIITLTTSLGEYQYRVVSTKVVASNDVAVLDAGRLEILTLVTCYPFYFVGGAPDRFIVRAERVSNIS
jgi:sortase A